MDPKEIPSAEISSGNADYVAYDQKPKRGHVFW